ncbi:MAG TPA: LytS/YhcK type 5TM receptor domain-containing protein [Patescibacteria group bacterium]|nr:LytS/YhcK type 5TM receptor domain-containing protein [Patescibacteria group bacterium]
MLINWGYISSHLLLGLTFILGFVFLLTKVRIFRSRILKQEFSLRDKLMMVAVFGALGIMGTYIGFRAVDGTANTRAVGVILAGLIGGPAVGVGAGCIAGLHRFTLGGITAYNSAISAVLEGLMAGLVCTHLRKVPARWAYALPLTFVLEGLHMLFLLVMATPVQYEATWNLVQAIIPAMLVTNPAAVAAFIAIFDNARTEQEKVEGKAARLALQIAEKTMIYLRKGLNAESAKQTVSAILETVDALEAVALVSQEKVLAFTDRRGRGGGQELQAPPIQAALEFGFYGMIQNWREFDHRVSAELALEAVIAAPLKDNHTVIGALVFYKATRNSMTSFEVELIKGLSHLISTQLEVGKGEQQAALRAAAEIKALQAQINPHFLFNALNTIVYYCRQKPEIARDLLLKLAQFYRNNLSRIDDFIDLKTELQHIDAYIQIEAARFSGKLSMVYEIPTVNGLTVPPFILQPIVENAVKHGLYPQKTGGQITVRGYRRENRLEVVIQDDGVGMDEETCRRVLLETPERKGIGLVNVDQRLRAIYGEEYGLNIESAKGKGTSVSLAFPLNAQ